MREDRLRHISDKSVTILYGMVTVLVLSFLSYRYYTPETEQNSSLLLPLLPQKGISEFLHFLLNLGTIIISGILLLRLNKTYILVRSHTTLPIFFFFLFESCNPEITAGFRIGNILTPVFLLSLYILYSTFQNEKSQSQTYAIGLLIGTGSLFWTPFILFIPLFWIGLYQMRTLTVKSFLATLIALITVIWLLYGGHFIWKYPLQFDKAYISLTNIELIQNNKELLQTIAYLVPLVIIGIISVLSSFYQFYGDKTSTRAYNGFINLVSIFITLFICLNISEINHYMPLLNACAALQAAHLFNNTTRKSTVYIFYFIILLYILLFIWSLLPDLANGVI